MMTNSLPHPDASMPAILNFLASSHRYGMRNRCLYRLRLVMRYRDLADLRLGDVLNKDGSIVDTIHGDGWTLRVDAALARDLLAYAKQRCARSDLKNIVFVIGHEHLFRTQKSPCFSPGWLAQLFTHLDRATWAHFTTSVSSSRP